MTENDVYNSGLETINIPTDEVDKLHLPTREKFPQLYRVIDRQKINELKTGSVEGKKEETIRSLAEEIRQEVTKTLQKVSRAMTLD